MMTNKKILLLSSLALVFCAQSAYAEFSFSCGEGREKGPAGAEIGFVDSLESSMKLYLKGEEQPDEKLGFKPTESNSWIITMDLEEKGSRRFEFSVSDSTVQEFKTSSKGKDRKVGAVKKCDFKQVKAE